MLPAPHTLVWLIAVAVALVLLRAVAWRIGLLVNPASVRVRAAGSSATLPDGFDALSRALASEGFTPIGVHLEQAPLARPLVSFDFANPGARTFASVHRGRGGAQAYLLSVLDSGEWVRTQVQAADGAGGYSGSRGPSTGSGETAPTGRGAQSATQGAQPATPLAAALAAHLARCGGHSREGHYDAEERLALARAWFDGAGAAEVRRQQLAPVLWSLATLGMVVWALWVHP